VAQVEIVRPHAAQTGPAAMDHLFRGRHNADRPVPDQAHGWLIAASGIGPANLDGQTNDLDDQHRNQKQDVFIAAHDLPLAAFISL
jgi:hypothetical protein